MDESDKTMIDRMMPLLNEYQRRAFLNLYCEKLRYGSATQISNFTGISPTTLTAAKCEVAKLENDPTRPPAGGRVVSILRAGDAKAFWRSSRKSGTNY